MHFKFPLIFTLILPTVLSAEDDVLDMTAAIQ